MTGIFVRMAGTALCTAAFAAGLPAYAADVMTIEVTIKDHKFSPAEIHVPAETGVKLLISNLDQTPEEFDSKSLKVEKVIAAGGKVTVLLVPLKPGIYPFKGEYNEDTARGTVVSQ